MAMLGDASGRGEMIWILVALWAALGCIAAGMAIGIVDEIRRPSSNVRRAGVGVAFVAGFASLWLLVTPLGGASGLNCGPPLLALAEMGLANLGQDPACVDAMRLNAGAGLLAALASPVVVLATRGRWEE